MQHYKGKIGTTWTPYKNGQEIPSPYAIMEISGGSAGPVTVTGTNILDCAPRTEMPPLLISPVGTNNSNGVIVKNTRIRNMNGYEGPSMQLLTRTENTFDIKCKVHDTTITAWFDSGKTYQPVEWLTAFYGRKLTHDVLYRFNGISTGLSVDTDYYSLNTVKTIAPHIIESFIRVNNSDPGSTHNTNKYKIVYVDGKHNVLTLPMTAA